MLLAVVLLATVAPAAAAADLPAAPDRPPLTTTRATESLRIAQEFWGASTPCVRVYAADPAELAARTGEAGVIGAAQASGCAVWVSARRLLNTFVWRISMCTSIVHEVGHVLGLGHSPDRRSVMSENRDDNQVVWACYRRFMPKGWARWWRDVYGAPEWLGR